MLTMNDYRDEMMAALEAFDRNVVMLEITPPDFAKTIASLIPKAIEAYEKRDPSQNHGVALDKYVTVILSARKPKTSAGLATVPPPEKPICNIYLNLYSGYFDNREQFQVSAP